MPKFASLVLAFSFAVAAGTAVWCALRSPTEAASHESLPVERPFEEPSHVEPTAASGEISERAQTPSASRAAPTVDDASVSLPAVEPPGETRSDRASLDAPELDSFLTDAPDIRACSLWAERFAFAAEVDVESVEVDEASGRVTGVLTAPGGGLATFSIRGERYEVEMWPPASGARSAELPLRSIRWGFANDSGAAFGASLSVQHHPDTHRPVANFVEIGAERIVGWTFATSDRGSVARPVVVRALAEEPGAWRIGWPETTPGADWPGLFIDNSHRTLLAKLSAHAPK